MVEGTIQQLFEGHHMNYIECINVDYKSTRKESFYGRDCKLFSLTVSEKICSLLTYILYQIFNLMSKAVGMFMHLLTSMWKWNA